MHIFQLSLLSDNYSYIFIEKKKKLVGCIDPAISDDVINFLENRGLGLDFILNTHHHLDHIGGNIELKKKYKCEILGNLNDQNRIPGFTVGLKDGEEFTFGELKLQVIHTPGHTLGHICFYCKEENILFSGDSLFSLGCGRIFEGTYKQMLESMQKLRSLPEETKIFCGHEYTLGNLNFALKLNPNDKELKELASEINDKRKKNLSTIPSTIKKEKKFNPFFKFDDKDYFSLIGLEYGSYENNFKRLRIMKDNF